jgi:hypothetical protein
MTQTAASGARPSHAEIFARLGEIQTDLRSLSDRVGHESTGADGAVRGSGLTGRLIRAEARLEGLDALKNKALGGFAALTLVSALLLVGLKAWITSLLGAKT